MDTHCDTILSNTLKFFLNIENIKFYCTYFNMIGKICKIIHFIHVLKKVCWFSMGVGRGVFIGSHFLSTSDGGRGLRNDNYLK